MSASHGFRFDTGRLCLDLLATVGGGLGPEPVERLDSPARLGQWLVGARLVPRPDLPLGVDADWVARFAALRALLHRIVHATLDGRSNPRDLGRLNAYCLPPTPIPRLELGVHGTPLLRLAGPPACDQLLSAIARDAADLLADRSAVAQLRQCERESCDVVYVDSSRGHRRRWCSSAACGNRERVARHRRRVLAGGG